MKACRAGQNDITHPFYFEYSLNFKTRGNSKVLLILSFFVEFLLIRLRNYIACDTCYLDEILLGLKKQYRVE